MKYKDIISQEKKQKDLINQLNAYLMFLKNYRED